MSVTSRKRPCPSCGAQVRPREVFDREQCPECGTALFDLFEAANEDPQHLGGASG